MVGSHSKNIAGSANKYLVVLQQLEYFTGMLILLTNRVGVFSEDFRSRIHIALYFPSLDKKATVRVWEIMLCRLAVSRPELEFDVLAILRYAESHYELFRSKGWMPWNGRQICNACQSALALAEFEAVPGDRVILNRRHLRTIVQASREFDEYVSSTHGSDNDTFAARRNLLREDDFSSASPISTQSRHVDRPSATPSRWSYDNRASPTDEDNTVREGYDALSAQESPPKPSSSFSLPKALHPASESNSDSELEQLELEKKMSELKLRRKRKERDRRKAV